MCFISGDDKRDPGALCFMCDHWGEERRTVLLSLMWKEASSVQLTTRNRKGGGNKATHATYAVGPAQLDCGWSDVIVHTCSQFLSSCRVAHHRCRYSTCLSVVSPLLLLSPITSIVKAPRACWEKALGQTTDVFSDPRPQLPLLKASSFPAPCYKLTKHQRERWWSPSAGPPSCPGALTETFHLEYERLGDSISARALPTATAWHVSQCEVFHTGSATVDLLTGKLQYLLVRRQTCFLEEFDKGKLGPVALFWPQVLCLL